MTRIFRILIFLVTSDFINLASSYIFVRFTNHTISLMPLNDIHLNYLSHVYLVLAPCCSFRPETGLSSLNNAFVLKISELQSFGNCIITTPHSFSHHYYLLFHWRSLNIPLLSLGWEELNRFNSGKNLSELSKEGNLLHRVGRESSASSNRLKAK